MFKRNRKQDLKKVTFKAPEEEEEQKEEKDKEDEPKKKKGLFRRRSI